MNLAMRVLVAGLGSMGKRRIRCLRKLGFTDITGFDPRADRREETQRLHGVRISASREEALASGPEAIIISVPPDAHHSWIEEAVSRKCHAFIEASVVDTGIADAIARLNGSGLVIAPSATLLFHPAIQTIRRVLESGRIGTLSNVMLHSGQYLPDWHTYEPVSDYYVSNRATGGAREIVPFELSWVVQVFGFPARVAGNVRKTIAIEGAETIDDTDNALLDYRSFLMTMTVDVVSRHAVRRLVINGSAAQLVWDWNVPAVRLFDGATGQWEELGYALDPAQPGYNPNIGEQMYVDELRTFFEAMDGGAAFPRDLAEDLRVLGLLYAIEESNRTSAMLEPAR
ncbi:MAG: Gfo/Idh/MocA family oxidoreductase [Acidobacteriota bacterium]